MSLYDYEASKQISLSDPPFYALIMAAARKADTENLERLTIMWPDTIDEFRQRYIAPGGLLEGEEL